MPFPLPKIEEGRQQIFRETAQCYWCGFLASGIAFQDGNKWSPYLYICEECANHTGDREFKDVKRLDRLEQKALPGGVEAVGEYLKLHLKGVTDLAEMDEFDAEMIVKLAWQGCAKRLRELIAADEDYR